MSRTDLLKGYVIHQRPMSDSRKILDIFTAQAGRVTGVVRISKKSPALILFQPYLFSWLGKQEFKTFTGYESEAIPFALKAEQLYCGFYLNELLQRLLPALDESTELFAAYEMALAILANQQPPEPHLRRFELVLLRHLGYEYSFIHEGFNPTPLQANGLYHFNPQQGFVPITTQSFDSPNKSGLEYSGADILAYHRGESSPAVLHLLKRVCRHAIAARLGREPLRSRELFRRD